MRILVKLFLFFDIIMEGLTTSQVYYLKNKEMLKKRSRDYYDANREYVKDKVKAYYKENREDCLERVKIYRENNFYEWDKRQKIATWKRRGMTYDNFDELYDLYISIPNCELCGVELMNGLGKRGRCCDHEHNKGKKRNFRNIICKKCNNTREGERLRNEKGQYI
jgi:hypothetical protein